MATKPKDWIDFAALKTNVSWEEVLDNLGILDTLARKGDELKGPCPMPKHVYQGGRDKRPTFGVNLNPAKYRFNCFVCHAHGDVIEFVAKFREIPIKDAAAWLSQLLKEKPPVTVATSIEGLDEHGEAVLWLVGKE